MNENHSEQSFILHWFWEPFWYHFETQNGPRRRPTIHQTNHWFFIDFGLHFGLPLDSLWAPFGLPLASLWAPNRCRLIPKGASWALRVFQSAPQWAVHPKVEPTIQKMSQKSAPDWKKWALERLKNWKLLFNSFKKLRCVRNSFFYENVSSWPTFNNRQVSLFKTLQN